MLPVHRNISRPFPLDLTTSLPSFAYGLRRLHKEYNGFVVRLRRSQDSAVADISLGNGGFVSEESTAKITASGSSGLLPGSELPLNAFKGAGTLYVVTWYDQGANGFHATNTDLSLQPVLQLNSAGVANNRPSIVFDGSRYLDVSKSFTALSFDAFDGTFMILAKPTGSGMQSFGAARTKANWTWTWAVQMNNSDGKLYFYSGETTTTSNPTSVVNTAGLNTWAQYTFVRSAINKAIRKNRAAVLSVNQPANVTIPDNGFVMDYTFKIGSVMVGAGTGYNGHISEAIFFPENINPGKMQQIERNQMSNLGIN